jgi:vitamin B12 transporter
MNRLPATTAAFALLASPSIGQSVFELDDIIFTSNLADVASGRSGIPVEVITSEELAEAGDIEVIDYLARLPSLNVTRDGPAGTSASVRLRGLGEQYIAVRINGIDVSDPSGTQTEFNFAALTTSSIDRIEVLYGSQSAIYGSEAIGGVINIETVQAPEDPGTASMVEVEAGTHGTARASASFGMRSDRASLAFSATRLETEGFSAAEENDGNDETDGHDSTTLSARGTYQLTDSVTLGFDVLSQDLYTEFDAGPGPGGDGPQTEDTTREAGRLFANVETGAVTHEFSVSRSETRRYYPIGFIREYEGDRTEFRYLGTWDISEKDVLSFGFERSEESFSTDFDTGDVTIDSAFFDAIWAVTPEFDVTLSGRVDENSVFGTQPTLRAAAVWRPDAETEVRASIGQGSRAPSLYELFSSAGDTSLQPEESLSLDVSIERRFGDITLGATAFWIEIDDLIDFDGSATACGSGFGCYAQVSGTTETRGLELSARYEGSDALSIFGNYTYTDTETADGGRLARVPRHQVALGVDGTSGAGIEYEVLGRGAFDTAVSTFAPNPLDDYVVIDTQLGYEVADGVEAYLRVENLFDEEYQTSPGYSTSDRAFYLGLRASF